MMNVLIIEDEPQSADRMRRMIESFGPLYSVVGIMESNAKTKDFFHANQLKLDVILADIQLGDGLSFDSLREIPGSIPVIFTTAYDKYALNAFKFNSLDYLLKPVEEHELRNALEKVMALQGGFSPTSTATITDLLELISNHSLRYRERFLIPSKADEYLIVPSSNVSHFAIHDGVVRMFTLSGESYLLDMTLDQVETSVDPNVFMRLNRQFIVNVAAVEKLSLWFHGKMRVFLKGFPDKELLVSKEKVSAVKKWLNY